MADADDSGKKAWVEHWVRLGPKLEEIRRHELRIFNYEEHFEAVDALLQIGCQFARPRLTSGLVEQQRLFKKARR